MNEQSMRFRMGLFVLAALGLLAVMITLFGGAPTLFTQYDRFTAVFTDAPGVSPGTPVRRSGIRIGKVETLYLDSQTGKVKVVMLIEKSFPLYEGDQAVLFTGILAGDTAIDIVVRQKDDKSAEPSEQQPEGDAGKQPRKPLRPGAEIPGVPPLDVRTLFKGTESLVPEASRVLNEMSVFMKRIDKMPLEDALREFRDLAKDTRAAIPDARNALNEVQATARNIGALSERIDVLVRTNQDKAIKALDNLTETLARVVNLLSEENQRNITASLKNLRAGTDNLPALAKNADETLKEFQKVVQRLQETLKKSDEVVVNLQQATKPFAERSGSIVKNLDEGLVKLNQTMTDARDLLRNFGKGDGTLPRLISDPALYKNLNDTICMINRLIPRLEYILKDVNDFADKIARHPELLGVRGAVAPSAGLKESPPSTPVFKFAPR